MSETPPVTTDGPVDVAHPAHNPFDLPRPRNRNGLWLAILVAAVLHGVIGFYLWKWKFKAEYQQYSDEKTNA